MAGLVGDRASLFTRTATISQCMQYFGTLLALLLQWRCLCMVAALKVLHFRSSSSAVGQPALSLRSGAAWQHRIMHDMPHGACAGGGPGNWGVCVPLFCSARGRISGDRLARGHEHRGLALCSSRGARRHRPCRQLRYWRGHADSAMRPEGPVLDHLPRDAFLPEAFMDLSPVRPQNGGSLNVNHCEVDPNSMLHNTLAGFLRDQGRRQVWQCRASAKRSRWRPRLQGRHIWRPGEDAFTL